MRRAAAVIALTVIGLYLVLSFKSSPLPRNAASATATVPPAAAPSDGANRGQGQPPAGPPPNNDATPPTTTAGPAGTRTVTGSLVSTRYGDVQVAVVLAGTRIVDVKAIQLPFDRARSQRISEEAGPILLQEVLDAQSANIDLVSGATYTSDAYERSLQAALDRAHA